MNKLLPFFFILLFSISLNAQKSSIQGVVMDTLNVPLVRATVMLLDRDSTLLDYTQSGIDGYFSFKKVEEGSYIVKLTYVGYIPAHINVEKSNSKVDLGKIRLMEIATEIMEVVIKAARAPMKMIGDTLEYDISTFKVPEGSTVEDLLKRLPSMQVERDGTILSEGKVVSKVTVEGKDFFGGDPKTVTKNLPAEGVSKVQVFDKKSEEEILTGIEGNSEEKEMNLQLKDAFKNGSFGKIVAGYGTEQRAEIKGNYNVFNEKHQYSLVGVGNNTGRNGLGWDDYQDFMGSSSFDFFSRNLDYGFGGSGFFQTIRFGGSNSSLESQISSAFFTGSYGGYPKNGSGGLNYNYDHNKNKLGARYFYNFSDNLRNSERNRTTYYDQFVAESNSESENNDIFSGHRGEFSYETKIDSFHTFMLSSDLAYVNSSTDNSSLSTSIQENGPRITDSEVENNTEFGGKMIKTTALLRKTFRKKGRVIGLNMTYLYTDVNNDFDTKSRITFYNDLDEVRDIQNIDRMQLSIADKNAFNGNAMFSEPLGKKWFLNTFYNFNTIKQKGEVNVSDIVDDLAVANDYLSRIYDNDIFNQRIGTKLTFSNNGLNIVGGIAYKNVNLGAKYQNLQVNGLEGEVDQSFNSWLPYLSANYRVRRSWRMGVTLQRNSQEPNIDQLLPIVDDKNPLYITEGNPALEPKIQNSINLNANYSIPVSGFRIYIHGSYNDVEKEIIMDEKVDENLITYVKPVNYQGGRSYNTSIGSGIPIWGQKIRANIRYSINYSESFGLVNDIENETISMTHNPGLNIDISPIDWFSLYLNGSTRRTDTRYNINTSQDQEIIQNTLGAEVNLKFTKGFGMEASYDHNFYSDDRFGLDTSIPLINASVFWQFLEGKKGTLRLAAYDLLDKNIGISQYAGSNYVNSSKTESLSRYFMLSFTYDLRGGTPKNNNNRIFISF